MTHRDRQIVRWVGRLRMATAQQIAERFGLGRAVTYARLRGLVRLGLLEHARLFHGVPGSTWRRGRDCGGGPHPPSCAGGPAHLRTRLDLSTMVVDLEREFGRGPVSTEREMRAADTPAGSPSAIRPRFAVALAGALGQLQLTPARRPRLHFPDCAIADGSGETQNTVLAVELERTPKGRARLRRILARYVGARHIGAVRYYALGDRVRDLVETEVAAQRAQALIEVRDWPTHPHSRAGLGAAA